MKTQKRFKTKQELKHCDKESTGYVVMKRESYFGQPTEAQLYDEFITTDPHPFDSMDIKVRVTPKQSKKLQKKAEKMGYGRRSFKSPLSHNDPVLMFWGDTKDITIGGLGRAIELTYKQFINGTVPKKKKKEFKVGDWVEVVRGGGKGRTTTIIEVREPDYQGRTIKLEGLNSFFYKTEWLKHTTKPKEQPLRYKEWDVKVDNCGRTVQIGCQRFTKDELTNALKVMSEAQAHTDLKEFRAWLDNNSDKLGI